jgi:hypothetical protein
MVQDLVDVVPVLDVPVEHAADEVDALVADGERHPQISIHDLVDAVEWVLLVDDGVEQDAQSPDILLFAAVWLACQDLRGRIVYRT